MSTSERPRVSWLMRAGAVGVVLSLITLMTAFDFAPAALLADDAEPTTADSTDERPTPEAVALIPVQADTPFAAPVDLIARAGDDRLFIVELMGSIVAVDANDPDDDGDPTRATILDVADITLVEGERGLLGAAFDLAGERLYIHHSNLDGDSVIAEYDVDPDTGVADADSRRVLMTVDQPYANHNGGEVEFGPDGYLYLGFGDGGLANDPDRAALDLTTPLGKILRIDPTPTDDAPYTIPPDNPFVVTDDDDESDADEANPAIWSYGLRNPWKFSFDPLTGALWIADVGQDQWEEINGVFPTSTRAGRGLSFGWSAFEGTERFNDDQPGDGHEDPVFTYERVDGRCSISGGTVYRGTALPALEGFYVFGDYCTGELLAIDADPEAADDAADDDAELEVYSLGTVPALVAVAAGPDGELYALSVAGTVSRLN